MAQSKWSPRLRTWEEKYGEFYRDAIVEIAELSWEEIEELRAEIRLVGQSNCSWWLYHAAKDLLWGALPGDALGLEQLKRNATGILEERQRNPSSEAPK